MKAFVVHLTDYHRIKYLEIRKLLNRKNWNNNYNQYLGQYGTSYNTIFSRNDISLLNQTYPDNVFDWNPETGFKTELSPDDNFIPKRPLGKNLQ